jgi:hypothetical protein
MLHVEEGFYFWNMKENSQGKFRLEHWILICEMRSLYLQILKCAAAYFIWNFMAVPEVN